MMLCEFTMASTLVKVDKKKNNRIRVTVKTNDFEFSQGDSVVLRLKDLDVINGSIKTISGMKIWIFVNENDLEEIEKNSVIRLSLAEDEDEEAIVNYGKTISIGGLHNWSLEFLYGFHEFEAENTKKDGVDHFEFRTFYHYHINKYVNIGMGGHLKSSTITFEKYETNLQGEPVNAKTSINGLGASTVLAFQFENFRLFGIASYSFFGQFKTEYIVVSQDDEEEVNKENSNDAAILSSSGGVDYIVRHGISFGLEYQFYGEAGANIFVGDVSSSGISLRLVYNF